MKQVVLITGASAGIGKATAKQLAQQGYTVYGAARRLESMQDLVPLGVHPLALDVTDETAMVRGVQQLLAKEGRIDVLINCAGFGSYGAVEDVAPADAKYQLEVNLFGAARLIQLVLPGMRVQQRGKIVNISSIGGKIAGPLAGWYHASKFALEGLSDALRNEVKQFHIDVVVIEPGSIKSEWGAIAFDLLLKISGNTAYQGLARKLAETAEVIQKKASEPAEIASLIQRALASPRPRPRYVGGYLAKPLRLMRALLSDRMLDQVIMSQLK